jgi:holo-[acyl-carrier protein] synthase
MTPTIGVGIDLVDLADMQGILSGRAGKSFLDKTYTSAELTHAKSDAAKLAALFAAKEAAFKALGTGWVEGKDVEVVHAKTGAPRLRLHRQAKEQMLRLGATQALVSLSSTKASAVAIVILAA